MLIPLNTCSLVLPLLFAIRNTYPYVSVACSLSIDTLKCSMFNLIVKRKRNNFYTHPTPTHKQDQNRYHEDIFGITLRTAEIHNKSRATARIRMASQP